MKYILAYVVVKNGLSTKVLLGVVVAKKNTKPRAFALSGNVQVNSMKE